MKCILILCAAVVLVHGRPETPSGYNYQVPPSVRYGAPGERQAQDGSRSSNGQSGSVGFGSGSAASVTRSFGGGSALGGSLSSGQSSSRTAQFNAGQSGRSSFAGDASSNEIIVNKHVYVHIAPPELEDEVQQRKQIRVPPAQKNYKIIFIKAPAPAPSQSVQIPPIPQNEEKTLVYVLVKKPEEQAEIAIPTAAPTEPSKPEVYFIKYKTQKESGGQQGVSGVQQGITGGENFSQDDTVEVGARGRESANFGQGGSADGTSFTSSRSSSTGLSRQYGAPNSSGPY